MTDASRIRSVLVIDSTGRGHALCELFVRTDPAVRVYYGPGNPAADRDRIVSVGRISLVDVRTVLDFLIEQRVDLVFVSNIDALSRGYVDRLRAAGHRVIGPSALAAELEASKRRGKRFLAEHAIPTAAWRAFDDPAAAAAFVRELDGPCVVKTDGLTPDGDGSFVCDSAAEAELAIRRIAAGSRFDAVIEERMYGRELSVFAMLDGTGYLLFPTSLDYKRSLDGDAGKNCDGMGSIAPHPDDGPALTKQIRQRLLDPIVAGLRTDRLDYTGFLYVGCMITATGIRVVELNARFGDSEAEVVLPGVQTNFADLCQAVLDGRVARQQLRTDGLARCSVALTQGCLDAKDPDALPGWPFGRFASGQPVTGLADVDRAEASVFVANLDARAGVPVSAGGRVVHVVGMADTPAEARARAYRQLAKVHFAGMRYRSDIGELPPTAHELADTALTVPTASLSTASTFSTEEES